MRRIRVLYAGPALAGRRTTLVSLSGARNLNKLTFRLEGKEVRLPSGETILLDAIVPHTGSVYIESIRAATTTDIEWIRELALAVVAFLPTIDGVVFVAGSARDAHPGNLDALRDILRELNDAGLRGEQVPFVFQCNQRDHAGILPFAELIASLSTPRCAHVESIAIAGHGVTRALESLLTLIDHGTPRVLMEGLQGVPAKAPPSSPRRLFEEVTMQLTGDGEARAALHTSTSSAELVLPQGAIGKLGYKELSEVPGLAPGCYSADVVKRVVLVHEPGGWRAVSSAFIAARIRLRQAAVVRHERMAPFSGYVSTFLLGHPLAVHAAGQGHLAADAYERARAEGVCVVARQGSRLEPAYTGEMAVFHVPAKHVWIGRDEAGRVVEVSCHSNTGAAVLEQLG